MENTSENRPKKHMIAGLLAHVDAGKTTLSESMLYLGGAIRKPGRVDHKDAFLDTYELEKERGITIFSKQAVLPLEKMELTLLDTPGHVDFSAEMERTMQVLDYAVLVISGTDGVQSHTETLWRLLGHYGVPVFLFINKMDLHTRGCGELMEELQTRLDSGCVQFDEGLDMEKRQEQIAMCDEEALEAYLQNGCVDDDTIAGLISMRKVFPCYFGSALKIEGVEALLEGLDNYTRTPVYPEEFGARVYKIARDGQGNRLTYLKVTGGILKVRSSVDDSLEKINQIRIESGTKFTAADQVEAGNVCAVTGLNKTFAGQGLGIEQAGSEPVLEPVLNYRVQIEDASDVHKLLPKMRQLEEEDPQLHVLWNETLQEIQIQVMGEVQLEILSHLIKERFGTDISFGAGNIVYKETITDTAEGVGHYEPLRHYAEVHLLLEPLPPGSGLVFAAKCSEDLLDKNWQRLILTHLQEKEHIGVLTGSPVTDIKITLIAGKAHIKHTEGGDFRQAVYRAVRHGLVHAKSILLEPFYAFRLEVLQEYAGRAMTDIQRMHGRFEPPQTTGEITVLNGFAPVACMQKYLTEVLSYTKGKGRLFCSVSGYEPCHNEPEVLEKTGYDWERDVENPADSVFCSHGAGVLVKCKDVYAHMHLERAWKPETVNMQSVTQRPEGAEKKKQVSAWEADKELEEIFTRTFGPVKRRDAGEQRIKKTFKDTAGEQAEHRQRKKKEQGKCYLLVDGYNIIFAWKELKELAEANLDAARYKLMDSLCSYQGYTGVHVICVFDAYKVKGNHGTVEKYHNIEVVYTKEAETADMYIEKVTLEIGKRYRVTVATSDALEQLIIAGHGAVRISAARLYEEIEHVNKEMRRDYQL